MTVPSTVPATGVFGYATIGGTPVCIYHWEFTSEQEMKNSTNFCSGGAYEGIGGIVQGKGMLRGDWDLNSSAFVGDGASLLNNQFIESSIILGVDSIDSVEAVEIPKCWVYSVRCWCDSRSPDNVQVEAYFTTIGPYGFGNLPS